MSDRPGEPADGTLVEDTFAELATLLWREREVLENVLFRLTEQQLLLAAGNTRWLPAADAEVRDAVGSLQEHEIARATGVEVLIRQYGLPASTSLRQLAEVAPDPWPTMLLDHREALRELTLEISSATAENRRMLLAGEQATREALEQVTGQPTQSSTPAHGYSARPLRGSFFILDEQA